LVKQIPRDLPKVIDIGKQTGIHFVQPAWVTARPHSGTRELRRRRCAE